MVLACNSQRIQFLTLSTVGKMMTAKKSLAVGLTAAALFLTPLSASAFIFGTTTTGFGDAPFGNVGNFTELQTVKIGAADVGKSFEQNWFVTPPGGFDLKATATFKVVSFSATELELDIWIDNEVDPMFQAAILSFGFGIDPDATAVLSSNGTVFDMTAPGANENFPGGFKNIDICIFAANNCAGGNINDGLQAGASDHLGLTITSAFGSEPDQMATLAAFPIKFQTQNGSFEFPGGGGGMEVSEPGSFGIALLGLTLATLFGRRRLKITRR